jgi:hypothetical protein
MPPLGADYILRLRRLLKAWGGLQALSPLLARLLQEEPRKPALALVEQSRGSTLLELPGLRLSIPVVRLPLPQEQIHSLVAGCN